MRIRQEAALAAASAGLDSEENTPQISSQGEGQERLRDKSKEEFQDRARQLQSGRA